MAYTDAHKMSRGQVKAMGGVALVHIVLAVGFVMGIRTTWLRPPDEPVWTTQIDAPKPQPPEQEVPVKQARQQIARVDTPQPRVTPRDPGETIELLPLKPLKLGNPGEGGGSGEAMAVEQPRVPVAPRFDPVAARPLGNPQSWVTTEDYPPAAAREGVTGLTGVRVSINSDGRVTGCTVTASSGSQLLDDTACRLITKRARFAPARGEDGQPGEGSFTTRFRWQLPAD